MLEPSGESYECGCGVKNNKSTIPPYGLRPLPPQGGQMPALAINKLRPLGGSGQIHPTYCVILSPLSIQGRRISKTLQKGDSSGFRPQNDGTLVSLASPRPLGEREETNQLNTFTPSDNKETPGFSINTKLQVINRRYYNLGSFLRFH